MPDWGLTPKDMKRAETVARLNKIEREKRYAQIRADLRLIKVQRHKNGDITLGIPSGKRVLIRRENALKFAKWIIGKTKNGS